MKEFDKKVWEREREGATEGKSEWEKKNRRVILVRTREIELPEKSDGEVETRRSIYPSMFLYFIPLLYSPFVHHLPFRYCIRIFRVVCTHVWTKATFVLCHFFYLRDEILCLKQCVCVYVLNGRFLFFMGFDTPCFRASLLFSPPFPCVRTNWMSLCVMVVVWMCVYVFACMCT